MSSPTMDPSRSNHPQTTLLSPQTNTGSEHSNPTGNNFKEFPSNLASPLDDNMEASGPHPEPEDDFILVQGKRRMKAQALPPTQLHTIIVRPQEDLYLPDHRPNDIAKAAIARAGLTPHEALTLTLQVRMQGNIATFKTPTAAAATKLAAITKIQLNRRDYPVKAYISAPANSCKGVIHGIAPDTPPETLMQHLRSFDTTILAARMMGRTETAIITFEGSIIPRKVVYQHALFRCKPHHPTAQFCDNCLLYGHRQDNCLNKTLTRCRNCTKQLKQADETHTCFLLCIHCGGEHRTNDPECPVKRQQDQRLARGAYLQRLKLRNMTQNVEPRQPLQKPPPDTTGTAYALRTPRYQPRHSSTDDTEYPLIAKRSTYVSPIGTPAAGAAQTAPSSSLRRRHDVAPERNPPTTHVEPKILVTGPSQKLFLATAAARKNAGEPVIPSPTTSSFNPTSSSNHKPTPIYESPHYRAHLQQQISLPTHTAEHVDLTLRLTQLEHKIDRLTTIAEALAAAHERQEARITQLEVQVATILKHLFPESDSSDMEFTTHSQKRQLPANEDDDDSNNSKTVRIDNHWGK